MVSRRATVAVSDRMSICETVLEGCESEYEGFDVRVDRAASEEACRAGERPSFWSTSKQDGLI